MAGLPLSRLAPAASLLERAKLASVGLDPGALPVQGPPGTGKTYSGARMIRALLRAGKRVGVAGPSHKVISNLIKDVFEADDDDMPTRIVAIQATDDDGFSDERFLLVPKNADRAQGGDRKPGGGRAALQPHGRHSVALVASEDMLRAWTSWSSTRPGQFSLANAVAVAPAAPRLLLLGDPQQLNQPLKGIHPPGSEVSVLEHLAGEEGILTPERGLFLGDTWRMRPEITAFTSELFYEGKLQARADLSAAAHRPGRREDRAGPPGHRGPPRRKQPGVRGGGPGGGRALQTALGSGECVHRPVGQRR